MTYLIVGKDRFSITDAYREGARAWREGKRGFTNPYPLSDQSHREWIAGFENDKAMRHLCDGIDVISDRLSPGATYLASEVDPVSLKSISRYESGLMSSSGMLTEAERYIARAGVPYGRVLAEHLRNLGHSVSTEFAEKIVSRALLGKEMQGAPLASHEEKKIEALTDVRATFLLTLGRLQQDYYATKISHKALAAALGKPQMWPGQVLRTMRRDHLGFLFVSAMHHCRPSPKGWTAISMLTERVLQARQNLVA